MNERDLSFWAAHGAVTDPGPMGEALLSLPGDPDALTEFSAQLVFHYRADGDWAEHGIDASRSDEINLCYVEDMLARLVELQPELSEPRAPAQRILGCCRDFSTLYVSRLRHAGVPARTRVGFASYFMPGWWLDHVVAEVWEGERWRMIDPELRADFTAPEGGPMERLDLGPDRFLTGPQAWLAARAGEIGAEHFVVHPELPIPQTRGWHQIAHNLIQDVAARNKTEMLLWDDWCSWLAEDVLADEALELFDELAAATADPQTPLEVIQQWGAHERLRVPSTVMRAQPVSGGFGATDVSRALGGVR